MFSEAKVIWTKDGLKSENLKLEVRIKELQSQYREIRGIFTQLERDYETSQGVFPVQRYSMLKRMIKRSVTDENLRKVGALVQSHRAKRKSSGLALLINKAKEFSGKDGEPRRKGSSMSGESSGRPMGGLLAACKSFAGKSDGIESSMASKKDLSKMSKQEVAEDNELKRQQIEEFQTKFQQAFETLEKLKADYETSKQRFPLARYNVMKELIKDITRDKSLR